MLQQASRRGSTFVAALAIAASLAAGPGTLPADGASPNPGLGVVVSTITPHEFRGRIRDLISSLIERIHGDTGEAEDPPLATTQGAVDPSLQEGGGAAPAPAAATNFDGLDFASWGAGWPPDPNGDVGQTYYIEAVNTSIGVFRKSDGVRVAAFTFNAFFDGTGTPCDANNQGDPVVLYDSLSGHWIIGDFAWSGSSGPFYECLAVSKGEDPTAANGWWFYAIQTSSNSTLADYPKLGVWPDGIYMSANMFRYGFSFSCFCNAYTFSTARVWALNRAQLESGQTVQVVQKDVGSSSYFTLLPSNVRGTAPPAGRPNLFASIWNSKQVRIWKFTVNWASPGSSTFTGPTNVALGTWNTAPTRVPTRSGNNVDTLQERLMMQNQYRNIGGQESLWLTHTVAGSTSSQAAVRWYQVNVTGGTVVTSGPLQQSTYSPDSDSRFMPSLAVDKKGNMAIGYSVSSSSLYPAIRYSARLAGDPLNQLTLSETSLIEGGGSPTNTCGGSACSRWGDYSAMTVDPVDDCTFWYTNEYYATSGGNWQTRIGSFVLPGCAQATGSISGTVTSSVGGGAVSGAAVTITAGGSGSATTASDGTYTISNVTAGTGISVTASKTGFTSSTVTGVTVTAGATTSNVNFSLTPTTGAISGMVTSSVGGGAISGATVTITSGGSGSATTASDGSYTIANVTPGPSIGVTASKTGFTTSAPVTVSVAAGVTTPNVNFSLTPTTGAISGKVVSAASGNPAISGATVTITAGGSGSATTASDGTYTIANVAPGGGINVTASKSGFSSSTVTGVTVTAGVTTSNVNFTLTPTTGVPNAPSLSAATNPRSCFLGIFCSGGGVRLTWTVPANNGSAITGYRIYRSTTSTVNTGGAVYATASSSATTYTDSSTTRGAVYYYKMVAVNGIGPSPASNLASATAG